MDTVIIEKIGIYKMQLPLHEPFVISLGPQDNADNIVIVINTDKGITGYGECSPYMNINGESIDTCFIVAQYIATVLKGLDALNIAACIAAMNKTIYANNSIKSAFDMALYDIAAKHANQPLYLFLGGHKNKAIITDMTVGLGTTEKMAADAAKFKAKGFQFIKVKLGETTQKDVARIAAIRKEIGDDIPLRIDANQGWDVPTAIVTLQALEPYNIEHCEEPIVRWDYMRLPLIRKATTIKLMADESCSDSHDAAKLAQLKACDYFNIKMGKSGGIFDALQIVKVAQDNQMKLQVGGFMESRLATTAFAHFSLASDAIVHFDFDTPLMIAEDPVQGGMQYKPNGLVEIDDTPGHGAFIPDAYLQKLKSVTI